MRVHPESTGLILEWIEADELWSFVGKKKNQVWVGLAMDATTRPVVAVHAGWGSAQDGKACWAEVPEPYRSRCNVYIDECQFNVRKKYVLEKETRLRVNFLFAPKKSTKGLKHRRCTNHRTLLSCRGFCKTARPIVFSRKAIVSEKEHSQ